MHARLRQTPVLLLAAALGLLVASPASAQVRIRGEAYSGEPFGVGRLEVELPEGLLPQPLGAGDFRLEEADGRVFYPAIAVRSVPPVVKDVLSQARRPALRLLGEVLDRPGPVSIYFLFRGQEPLRLTLVARSGHPVPLTPMPHPVGHQRLLGLWWQQYTAGPSFWQQRPDFPPVVENYLQAMLARRLGLPLSRKPKAQSWQDQLAEELGLAAGAEPVRLAYQRSRFVAPMPGEAADQPLPAAIRPPELEIPQLPAGVKIEPLANRVPSECFYVRYGNFKNFLWFQDTLALWGGDFQNLVATRGLDLGLRQRFETRLATQMTTLGRMLGDLVIADVAMIGTDLFLQEGGAYGLLFQARSTAAVGQDFRQQRQERVKQGKGIREEHLLIAGREVSFLTSPGGVRSFYAADGDYHFVTTSKTLMRRFLETGSGKGSLGATEEFKFARSRMPPARDDAVFVYLSGGFLRNLVSPPYRIEMVRRMEAAADIEMVKLALLASAAERRPGETIEQLAAAGFLPPGFGPRADGSRTILVAGNPQDSLRGPFGAFLPVPDVEVSGASRSEAEMYADFARFYQSHWQRLDPIAVGIRRRPLGENRDRVTIDLRMSPFARQNYERLVQSVGTADKRRIAPIAEDAAAFDVILPKQRLFGGIQAIAASPEMFGSPLFLLERLRNLVVGYLGTTGDIGLLTRLSRYVETVPDPSGYSFGRLGLWRRQTEQFTVFSFQRDVLQSVTGQLHFEEAERPAQLRLRAVDLSDARITPVLNKLGYARTRETSLGNLRLMHQVIEQLHVPPAQAPTVAGLLLDARLVDPLGGKYVLDKTADGVVFWTSTVLQAAGPPARGLPQPPPGYKAPPLDWFRGLNLDALLEPEALTAHVELDMQMPAKHP